MSGGFLPAPTIAEMPPLQGPSQTDWEQHRVLIKQLYVDQGLKLTDVVAIMLQHGHKASLRTYKNWIMKWKLDKKHKERDMIAIRRKDQQRSRIGKRSSFRVRGQVVTMQQVEEYFRRKKGSSQIIDAPTPSDVSCSTPSPPGTPRPPESYVSSASDHQMATRIACSPKISRIDEAPNLSDTNVQHFEVEESTLHLTVQDIYNILSENPTPSPSPSPPQALLVLESVLHSIRNYYDASFGSRLCLLDKDRSSVNNILYPEGCLDFFFCCNAAARLRNRGLFIESRRMLSKSFNLVGDILRSAELVALDAFFDTFLFLIQKGHHDILLQLRGFIGAMASNIFKNDHPLAHIYQSICPLDENYLEQALILFWKCTIDKFDEFLGPFHELVGNLKIDYAHRIYGSKRLLFEEERFLRGLLAEWTMHSGTTSQQSHSIMEAIACNLMTQNRCDESEAILLETISRGLELGNVEDGASARRMLAWCQYRQHKFHSAEESLRSAIEVTSETWGRADPAAIKYMIELQIWLEVWGREEQAIALKADIDERIGKDEVDEEMALGFA